MKEVSKGSDAIIIKSDIPEKISDSIGFGTSYNYSEDDVVLKLTDSKFENDYLQLDKFPTKSNITYIKPNIEILGKSIESDSDDQANFIKTKLGKGTIYVHTEPLFLTNYYLLKNGSLKYTQDVLSYLPDRETLWFVEKSEKESTSVMRFILSKDSFK